MACRAGVADPFRKAEILLQELAGWSVSAETLRRRCHEQAEMANAAKPDRSALPEAFARAQGDLELHIDAGKVNTVEDGWRDVKVAAFAVRKPGESCDPVDLAERQLPAPAVRSVVAAIEDSEEFGTRVEAEALRLKVPLSEGLSVLGDGAEWIWTLQDDHFHGSAGVLDFWHATQKLGEAGRGVMGKGEEFERWFEGAKGKVAGDGYVGAVEMLGTLSSGAELVREGGEAVAEALNYFGSHQERMKYALRLRQGRAIGTGLVEGSIKQLLNLRMKRTGARWRVAHVGSFVEFIALADSPEWKQHWSLAA